MGEDMGEKPRNSTEIREIQCKKSQVNAKRCTFSMNYSAENRGYYELKMSAQCDKISRILEISVSRKSIYFSEISDQKCLIQPSFPAEIGRNGREKKNRKNRNSRFDK